MLCRCADFFAEKNRGKAFGLLQMTSLLGGSLGALYATNLGGARPLGYEGWRFAFFSVAMLSILIGLARELHVVQAGGGHRALTSLWLQPPSCKRCMMHQNYNIRAPTWMQPVCELGKSLHKQRMTIVCQVSAPHGAA